MKELHPSATSSKSSKIAVAGSFYNLFLANKENWYISDIDFFKYFKSIKN